MLMAVLDVDYDIACTVAKRTKLFNRNVRFGLFTLFANWSGKFGTAYGAIELR